MRLLILFIILIGLYIQVNSQSSDSKIINFHKIRNNYLNTEQLLWNTVANTNSTTCDKLKFLYTEYTKIFQINYSVFGLSNNEIISLNSSNVISYNVLRNCINSINDAFHYLERYIQIFNEHPCAIETNEDEIADTLLKERYSSIPEALQLIKRKFYDDSRIFYYSLLLVNRHTQFGISTK